MGLRGFWVGGFLFGELLVGGLLGGRAYGCGASGGELMSSNQFYQVLRSQSHINFFIGISIYLLTYLDILLDSILRQQ